MKLLAIGDYTQRTDERKVEDRKPIGIDKMTFDEVLAKQELGLTLSVPNRLQEEGRQRRAGGGAADQLDEGLQPGQHRRAGARAEEADGVARCVVALKGPLGNAPAFRKAIESVFRRRRVP
ncbi:type VI secretion system contractile sheath small subunit [Pseudomonas aeruginosa]|nr:type VI secretion system contractile sheath small subunit [Pseudomonas aeruginosa]